MIGSPERPEADGAVPQHDDGAGPQQEARPFCTCRAALPYFSLTMSRMLSSFIGISFLSRILDTLSQKKGFQRRQQAAAEAFAALESSSRASRTSSNASGTRE